MRERLTPFETTDSLRRNRPQGKKAKIAPFNLSQKTAGCVVAVKYVPAATASCTHQSQPATNSEMIENTWLVKRCRFACQITTPAPRQKAAVAAKRVSISIELFVRLNDYSIRAVAKQSAVGCSVSTN